MNNREVSRVLVMLEYAPGDSCPDGEVFDLTALVLEMQQAARSYRASIKLDVECEPTYQPEPAPKFKLKVSWGGDAGKWVYGCAHLDDVINSAMPDGDRVEAINRRKKRLEKKAEELGRDAMIAKLEQVAAIRHQHPIARVTSSAIANEVRALT